MPAGDVNQAGHQQQIADNLQRGMPAPHRHPVQKDQVKQPQRVPQNDQRDEIAERHRKFRILLEDQNNSQQQRDDEKSNAVEPAEPVA